jgi:hypothetical protein
MAIMREPSLEGADAGKRRCVKRVPARNRVNDVEPENSKGRADVETVGSSPSLGVITC